MMLPVQAQPWERMALSFLDGLMGVYEDLAHIAQYHP
jgi:hypothetical protein